MKVYDISQEVFSCRVFPGDPRPEKQTPKTIAGGDFYNLTLFSMCAHNGTHVDAPYHFLEDGKTIDALPLDAFVGPCCVVQHTGNVDGETAKRILETASGAERILIAGKATVTREAAHIFADAGLKLLGNESQSVGPEDAPAAVHKILLGAGVVLLEGIVLDGVQPGQYILCAAPLNLGGADGAPCRACLIEV